MLLSQAYQAFHQDRNSTVTLIYWKGMEPETEPPLSIRDYPLLKQAPPHNSPEFITFLEENNPVVRKTEYWLLIENCKYHVVTHPHYTAFPLNYSTSWPDLSQEEMADLRMLLAPYNDWFKYENAKTERSIDRLHMHIVRDYDNWIYNAIKFFKNELLSEEKSNERRGFDLYKSLTAEPPEWGETNQQEPS